MTALDLFEEWRFLLELLGAMLVFILPYRPLTPENCPRFLLCLLPLCLLSIFYFPVRDAGLWFVAQFAHTGVQVILSRILFFVSWYLLMVLVSLFCLSWIFKIPKQDLIFIALAGYSLQHIVFVLIHELLAQMVWPDLTQFLSLYALVSLAAAAGIYQFVYHYFKPEMSRHDRGKLVKTKTSQLVYSCMLLILLVQTFAGQHIFNTTVGPERSISAIFSITICALILYAQFVTPHAANLVEDQFIMEQLLKERKKQYQIEKEAIDHLNYRLHDFKNHILALKDMSETKKEAFYQEILGDIANYDYIFKLENESISTLLSQKSYYCQMHNIQLTHIIDSHSLDFIAAIDLYTIVGNALDNAIDCVEKYPVDSRQIPLHIKRHKQFVQIEISNRLLEDIAIDAETGLPKSTKDNSLFHGFGLKSIQSTLDKYKGWLSISCEHATFILTIMIPIPKKDDKKTKN